MPAALNRRTVSATPAAGQHAETPRRHLPVRGERGGPRLLVERAQVDYPLRCSLDVRHDSACGLVERRHQFPVAREGHLGALRPLVEQVPPFDPGLPRRND